MKLSLKFHPFSLNSFYNIFGKSKSEINSIKILYDYLEKLRLEMKIKKITILEEKEYVEKFYLRDYSRYYAEAFNQFERFTIRLHFFSCDMNHSKLNNLIKSNDLNKIKKFMEKFYLGYIVVKPVTDKEGVHLIGRSVIKPYPDTVNGDIRYFLKIKNFGSLFGMNFIIESIPFHEQDIAVGVCASACLWMTQFAIKKWYDIPILSLAEITEASFLQTAYSTPDPIYPSSGLNLAEIANYVRKINVHFHRININDIDLLITEMKKKNIKNITENMVLIDLIKSYLNANFPIICGLQFYKEKKETDMHAVLITGFRKNDKGIIKELYVHDDRINPYSKTTFIGNSIKKWNNKLINRNDVDEIVLKDMLIPVDPLVKLRFIPFASYFYLTKKVAITQKRNCEVKLYHINDYKNYILCKNITSFECYRKEKKENTNRCPKKFILSKNLPRYIWVIHLIEKNQVIADFIFDANNVIIGKFPIAIVNYN